ncbi:LPXTG cell wall anchor domain-containing protein [Arthrobacter sp. H5]|uniref:LPXTG cell wall anchor domain-containing protein n=1 Tax=Arthrobacter sp. H5 TaxID=1267973 RepID=UPI000488C737|nr:LPXTG cell wall anchor domain-containing protein [Arthrobacter sp. H5]
MKKFASVLAITASLVLFSAGAANAQDPSYVPGGSQGTVSEGTVAPGETVIFSGSSFLPGESINITVTFEPASQPAAMGGGAGGVGMSIGGPILMATTVLTETTTADANGNFSFPVSLEEEGTYTLTAVGAESGNTVSVQVVVDASLAGTPVAGGSGSGSGDAGVQTGGGLADTGLDSGMLLWGAAGLGALGLGAASVVVARRKAAVEA